ncbi:hypothetical protein C5C94_11715 [Rathayibacter sp. AY1C3]|nr:hypothetical protein C5C94_11715 [Rathayibacter sp. AY1C3]PPI28682.1 hypothetical protein C5D66_14050 [Rathayibacter sp. AY1B4]
MRRADRRRSPRRSRAPSPARSSSRGAGAVGSRAGPHRVLQETRGHVGRWCRPLSLGSASGSGKRLFRTCPEEDAQARPCRIRFQYTHGRTRRSAR